jgi:hypothetical protein
MVLKGSAALFKEFFDIEGRNEIRTWGPVDWYGECSNSSFNCSDSNRGESARADLGVRFGQASRRSSSSGSTAVAVNGLRFVLSLETLFCGILGESTSEDS